MWPQSITVTTCSCTCSCSDRFQHLWDSQLSALGHCVLYHLLSPFIAPSTHCTCSVEYMCRHSCIFHTHMCYYILFSYFQFLLIPRAARPTLFAAFLKAICQDLLLAYNPCQLIKTVKRVSLRGLVTQSYPDACQHCHVIWLVSAQALGLFPF